MINLKMTLTGSVMAVALAVSGVAFAGKPVGITRDIMSVPTNHLGKTVDIKRGQDNAAKISKYYEKTSRPCPPFCVLPISLDPKVKTIGELELLQHVKAGDALLVDSRTPDWINGKSGTIPGAVNIPWKQINIGKGGADDITMGEHLEYLGGKQKEDDSWDFSAAHRVIFFCNGYWCGQSPANIKTLLSLGYPGEKIFWYRGGMQAWSSLGFNTVEGSNTKESYMKNNLK
ncbi:MAG: rhodanese-like domain-containing protein [Arenicellales bacterium]